MSASVVTVSGEARTFPGKVFFDGVKAAFAAGARPVTMFGGASKDPAHLKLTAVLDLGGALEVWRTGIPRDTGYHALSSDIPAFHMFERELAEQHHITPHGHPWLKPVRYPGAKQADASAHPFYPITGHQVHEVAVGPIHAGVIEPGHFRFMCTGETVQHLEIQLGYQHRGVEALLPARNPWTVTPLVETIAGDSSVAHAWAHAAAVEALVARPVTAEAELSRAVGLELERVAMHLAGLSALAGDVAFLQGASSYGRLRTTAINTSMALCGSRFGRGWMRPGGVRAGWTREQGAAVKKNLALLRRDTAIMDGRLLESTGVEHRLQGVGTVTRAQALQVGLVGLPARACGVELDLRVRHGGGAFAARAVNLVTHPDGDCWARAVVRVREIAESLRWLDDVFAATPELVPGVMEPAPLAPETLVVSAVEGWRGEVIHALETDSQGRVVTHKVQDPSLVNWFGLALAVRNNEISDFPICNKSFDLSYCGNDL